MLSVSLPLQCLLLLISLLFQSFGLSEAGVSCRIFSLTLLLANHLSLQLLHGLLAFLLFEKEAVDGHFQFTALAQMLRLILEVLQQVVDETARVEATQRWTIILLGLQCIEPIVTEDLDQLGQDGPLIEQTLDRHLNLKLA